MTTWTEIPLFGIPQIFSITLSGQHYRMQVLWRDVPPAIGWFLDIADQNGNALVCGIPLVTGSDLLAQYEYLNFYGGLVLYNAGDPDAPPDFTTLGTLSKLYWVTNP